MKEAVTPLMSGVGQSIVGCRRALPSLYIGSAQLSVEVQCSVRGIEGNKCR